jgi:post-segregation antitoxin (ccd killing protein)
MKNSAIEEYVTKVNTKRGKQNYTIRIDANLLELARLHFKGNIGNLFELAIKEALAEKQARKGKPNE